jgi:ABC-type dipeptide/oligopeptide/nickel transport system permease component
MELSRTPVTTITIVVAILVVVAVAFALGWWMKRTKGGRRAP